MLDNIHFLYKKIMNQIFDSNLLEKRDITQALDELSELKGMIAVSLIDWNSNSILGAKVKTDFNIALASHGNAKVVKAKMKMLQNLYSTLLKILSIYNTNKF